MPAAPGYSVRLGKPNPRDRELFMGLWGEYLTEHHRLGSDLPPSEDNLLEFLRVYDSYTGGSLWGVALLAESPAAEAVGVLLGGEVPGGFNFRSRQPGRLAQLMGVYTHPAHRRRGVAWMLQDRATAEVLRLGFTRVQSLVLEGYPTGEANAFGWGARRVASLIEHDLVGPHGRSGRTKGEGQKP